jgi:hypothetical protein
MQSMASLQASWRAPERRPSDRRPLVFRDTASVLDVRQPGNDETRHEAVTWVFAGFGVDLRVLPGEGLRVSVLGVESAPVQGQSRCAGRPAAGAVFTTDLTTTGRSAMANLAYRAERAVLGALLHLQDPDLLEDLRFLTPDGFSSRTHRDIFTAITSTHADHPDEAGGALATGPRAPNRRAGGRPSPPPAARPRDSPRPERPQPRAPSAVGSDDATP